ncbi:RagB/SusD family nutrient uptake outer membrane protein [Cyclobacterium jeungdonense]|uniref:RagB/SusD family nutrient uptake outer membrane protein n=1 Tax=Cyclobacterium jeungdonense TaxID=708087 RepID=A0ABT8CBV4_9BACT|nr:RagB/SusD family nutrient uptake outer membrane protein [Cyclobacterium jeungdonense]MDN3689856.1 RagB/SusD family nutrient uptake outer membrane protein [Cyclobacterium jeungdonense]
MKNLSIIFGLTLLLGLNACEEILIEDPVSLATADGYYITPGGIEDGLKASYTTLRSFYGQQNGFFLTVTGTDIFTNGFGGIANNPHINNYSPNFLGTSGTVTDIWNNLYVGINQCNTVVNKVQEVTGISSQRKAEIEAEARFLRALYYFHLVQQWGDVHFSLEETAGVQTEANRTPVSTIYDTGILPDLEFAVANLPVTASEPGRVYKAAAEGLLARVQLTLGNWEEAERLASNVIDNYNFELVKPYIDLWDINNEDNSEFVWTVQFTDDPLLNGPGNSGHLYFIFDYTFNPAMVRDTENGRPFQRFLPTNYLFSLYDRDMDARWDGSFKTVWYANIPGEINGHQVNPGDTAIHIVMEPVPDEVKQAAPYWIIDYKGNWIGNVNAYQEIGTNQRRNYPSLRKFLDPLRPSINETAGRRDFPVIRLAEMYLIAGEAAWRQNDNAGAAAYINVLRTRAAMEGMEEEMQVSPGDIDLDFILEERARELIGEKHRWYDLKRTGTLLERVRQHNLDAAPNIKEMHLVRPIPQTQIDRVSNPGEFQQNPGY